MRRKFPKPYSLRMSVRQIPIILLSILCLLFVGQRVAIAQANAGLTGTVLDATGSAVAGVKITITNQDTSVSTNLVSTSAGTYVVNGLNPGRYTITAEGAGFKKTVLKDVTVEVSTTSTNDITLSTGAATDSVEVTADQIALNTTQPQLGSTLEPEVVKALPVEVSGRGRQIDNLQFTAPGTTGDTFSHRIGGGVDFEQEIVYNGIPVAQPETEGYTTNFNPPFEMVSEFRVERSTFAAQFGLGQGALTYQMATGTNRYHGDLFEINRNNLFDSVGFFNGKDWNTGNIHNRPPDDHENNYGFTVGGPIRIPHLYDGRDKTFGHYSQEWFKLNTPNTNTSTVPTAAMKAGDFTGYVDSDGNVIPIYDPLTPGQQFECNGVKNVICPSRFSVNSASLLQYLPDPDRPGSGVGGLNDNKSYVPYPNPQTQQVWGFTVDQTLTPVQSLHFSMWHNHFHNVGFDNNPFVTPPNPLNSLRDFPAQGSGYLLTYNDAITSHLLTTAGIGWIGEINNQFNHSKYSFPAVADGVIPPNITFDEGQHRPTSWGTNGANSGSVNRKLGISIVNNWLWNKGRQTFNIGGDFRRSYQDDNEEQTAGGQFSFSNKQTANPDDPHFSGGSPFASYLIGLPNFAKRSNSQELKLRNFALSPYIQDDIKLSPKLTLNLGLRWDVLAPFTENNNNVVFFNPEGKDPHYGNLVGDATKLGSCTGCAGRSRAADFGFAHFGPRFGFAYKINDKSVIQGGFALAFLNGGAYEYGTNKVAVNYGNLLVGSFSRNATGSNVSSFGNWDTNQMPDPPKTPFNTSLGAGTQINALSKKDGYAPYTQQWNVNYQRELPYNMFLTVAFLGNRAIHLPSQLNPIDQLDPKDLALSSQLSLNFQDGSAQAAGFTAPYANFVNDFGGSATVSQALRPFPQFSNIFNNFEGSGTTYYQSGQIEIEKRFSDGLSFLAGYTLSHLMDNTGSGFSSFENGVQNKYNQKPEWAVSGSDEPQTLKLSGTYELPIGPHKKFLPGHGITAQVLGGWQVGWILDYEAGTASGPSTDITGIPGNTNRPDRVSGVKLSTANYTHERDYFVKGATGQDFIFDKNAFSQVTNFTLGNAVRNYSGIRQPALYKEAVNARKKFFFGERFTGILQVDYFNALNRTRFNGPTTNISDDNFGQAISQGNQLSNRQGQAQFRLEF